MLCSSENEALGLHDISECCAGFFSLAEGQVARKGEQPGAKVIELRSGDGTQVGRRKGGIRAPALLSVGKCKCAVSQAVYGRS